MYVYTSQVLCRNMYSLIKVVVILLNDLFIIQIVLNIAW